MLVYPDILHMIDKLTERKGIDGDENIYTYIFNIIQQRLSNAGKDYCTDSTLSAIKDGINKSDGFYESRYSDIRNSYMDNIEEFDEMMMYFESEDYFDKYLYLLEKSNLGNSFSIIVRIETILLRSIFRLC